MNKRVFIFFLALAASTGVPMAPVMAAQQSASQSMLLTEDETIMLVLAKAAPEFDLTVSEMYSAYANGLATVQEDPATPGVYLVTYGGLGIQIIIDGS